MDRVAVLIAAAGSGRRMCHGTNKQFLKIEGQEVLARTLTAFQKAKTIHEIVVIAKAGEEKHIAKLCKKNHISKFSKVVEGGVERQDSIYNGLLALEKEIKWVIVHDGARPFVSAEQIDAFSKVLFQKEALIMAVPAKDTIKRVKAGQVMQTIDRSELWKVQTPQGFLYDTLLNVHKSAKVEFVRGTDDACLMEWAGHPVHIFRGMYENIKITTPDDLYIGEAIAKMQRSK